LSRSAALARRVKGFAKGRRLISFHRERGRRVNQKGAVAVGGIVSQKVEGGKDLEGALGVELTRERAKCFGPEH